MLNLEIVFPIVISICVGLSFLAVNHRKVFLLIRSFIRTYTIIAIIVFNLYFIFFYTFSNIKSFVDLILESLVIAIPQLFYILLIYISDKIHDNLDKI